LWDMKEAVAEIKRTVAKGAKTVSIPSIPLQFGLPSVQDPYWKPLLDAIADEGIPLSIHVTGGARTGTEHMAMDSPIDAFLTKAGMCAMATAAEWLWSPWPRMYKNLKIVMSEGGIGWVPYILERADLVQKNHGPWTRQKWGGKRPSEVFREHFVSCFIQDEFGVKNRDAIGLDIITFENDYPHADITWPNSPEQLWGGEFENGKVGKEVIDAITHKNALRVYNFDPFSKIPQEKCTVGALRVEGKNVDMTPISGGGKPPAEHDHIVTAQDILKLFPQSVAPVKEVLNS
ncbi:MAG: amidohydrolase family protein, partial [Steroidobacteraceae bacterium]